FPGVETPGYSRDVAPGQRNVAAAFSAWKPTRFNRDAFKAIQSYWGHPRQENPWANLILLMDRGRSPSAECLQAEADCKKVSALCWPCAANRTVRGPARAVSMRPFVSGPNSQLTVGVSFGYPLREPKSAGIGFLCERAIS